MRKARDHDHPAHRRLPLYIHVPEKRTDEYEEDRGAAVAYGCHCGPGG